MWLRLTTLVLWNSLVGTLELTNLWARNLRDSVEWNKHKATIEKIEPSPQLLSEEKFTFQRAVSIAVFEHEISISLIANLDQTPLSHVSPGRYALSFKSANNVLIKGWDDKRQITGTFAVTLDGKFLPIQLIYQRKYQRCQPKFYFWTLSPLIL